LTNIDILCELVLTLNMRKTFAIENMICFNDILNFLGIPTILQYGY